MHLKRIRDWLKPVFLFLLVLACCRVNLTAQERIDSIMPVRGLCIAAPKPANLNDFIRFINEELATKKVNTLILRMDYNYQYESHPELRDSAALSKEDVKKLVAACRNNHIRIIPQINLFGHQSWASTPMNLLKVYPEFDETPWVKFPGKYEWPNPDGLYCKSYCPLHPKIHDVVFAIVDELCGVFEADAFHAGMDEVFYIGESKCPRCSGRDKAEIFAAEVRTLHDHLAQRNIVLWIWGDRLIDGKTTGLGEWEASFNNTYRAIDMIPKDVVICDWHYKRPVQTAVYFAMKGFNVVECPYRVPEVALMQAQDMIRFRNSSPVEMKERFRGMVQTAWSDADSFLDGYYGRKSKHDNVEIDMDGKNTPWNCFKALFEEILNMGK